MPKSRYSSLTKSIEALAYFDLIRTHSPSTLKSALSMRKIQVKLNFAEE